MYRHSDETVLTMFLQSPYYQHFCGRIYFEHQLPIDPSSLVRWRKQVGESGMKEMLLKSIEAAVSVDLVKSQSFTKVIVDTTVMEKAITHPTDSKLLGKSRQHTWLGGVVRDIERKASELTKTLKHELEMAKRLITQKLKDKNKLYSLHSPEVECISKGKSRTPYEFAVKASVV